MPPQIHQRADVEDVAHILAAERGVRLGVAEVADEERRRADDGRVGQLPGGDGDGMLRRMAAGLQQEHQAEHRAVHYRQKAQPGKKHILPRQVGEVIVKLPLQRSAELRQDEGAHGVITGVQRAPAAAEEQKQEHQRDGPQHAGDPPGQRHIVGGNKEGALCRQHARRDAPEAQAGTFCGPQRKDVDKAGQPLGQRRIQAGDVRQIARVHLTTSPT